MSADSTVGLADIGGAKDSTAADGTTSWRSLLEASMAKSRHIRGSNYIQLATVDPTTNEPRCRCIVFRGFVDFPPDHPGKLECDGMSCVAKMITEERSRKVAEVAKQSKAEMVWWFPQSNEQYRLLGDIQLVGNGQFAGDDDEFLQKERIEQWEAITDYARESFYREGQPGEPYSGENKTPPPKGGRDENGKILPPPDCYLLVLLRPTSVDYLRLENVYRQVDKYTEGAWSLQRLNI